MVALCAALPAAYLLGAWVAQRKNRQRVRSLVRFVEHVADGVDAPALGPAPSDLLGRLQTLLGTVASRTADRERARLEDEERQAADARIRRAIDMADAEKDVLDVASRALATVVPHAPAELLLTDADESRLHVAAISASGLFPACPVETPAACHAARRAQTIRFPNSEAIDACPSLRGRPEGACSAVCVPLSVMGRSIGVLHVTAGVQQPLADASIGAVEKLATHLGSRLGMLQALQAYQHQAATDPLTGLANRRAFEERGGAMLRTNSPVTMVLADLDHFKRLNDELGHAGGDRALRIFSQTMRATLRPGDFAARIGGEEFAFLLPGADSEGAVAAVGRFRRALALAIQRDDFRPFTTSFGAASMPHHGRTLKALMAAADAALYESKRAGRDRITVAGRGSSPAVAPAVPLAPERESRASTEQATEAQALASRGR